MGTLDNAARAVTNGQNDENALARVLMARYTLQGAINRVTLHAAELLGGAAFLTSNDAVCLLSSAPALAFHSPSRISLVNDRDGYLVGTPFVMA